MSNYEKNENQGLKNSHTNPTKLEDLADRYIPEVVKKASRRIRAVWDNFVNGNPYGYDNKPKKTPEHEDTDLEKATTKAREIAEKLALNQNQAATKTYYESHIQGLGEVDLTQHTSQVLRFKRDPIESEESESAYDFFVIIPENQKDYLFLITSKKRYEGIKSEKFIVDPWDLSTIEVDPVSFERLRFKLENIRNAEYTLNGDTINFKNEPDLLLALPDFEAMYKTGWFYFSAISVINFGKPAPRKQRQVQQVATDARFAGVTT